jgi:catechol 2,3-dioxygenase-like lactoylglutathione lyase family enzyme
MDMATPNLPSRDFNATAAFYRPLGFSPSYRDDGWMILNCGAVQLEFFHHSQVDPATSWFSCCLRLDDLDHFYEACCAANLPDTRTGWPRIHPPQREAWGGTVAALIDPDGTLLRLVQN